MFIKQRSLKLFANPTLICTVGLDKLAPKSLREILKIATDLASYIYAYGIFAAYEMSVLKDILDKQIAGVSAKILFTSHALVYDTLLMSLHFSPLMREVNALQCRTACPIKELFKEKSPNKKNEKTETCTEPLK